MKKNIFTTIISLAVVILSVIPIPEVPPLEGVPFIDKWVHFVMYGGVSIAMWMDFYFVRKERILSPKFEVSVFLFPIILGGVIEVVQEYLTTCRNGDMLDFYADAFGCLIGNAIALLIYLCLTKTARN